MKESLDRYDKLLIEQAENEGMIERVRPISVSRFKIDGFDRYDQMALERATDEGMAPRKQTLKPGGPVELNP
jgi:hypothetical protein